MLFPVPRQVLHLDERVRVSGPTPPPPPTTRDTSLPAQGYELTVDADGVRLASADDAGRRYGEATLAQLRRSDGSLPAAHIRDWPDVTVRGYMLDISRDRVPSR